MAESVGEPAGDGEVSFNSQLEARGFAVAEWVHSMRERGFSYQGIANRRGVPRERVRQQYLVRERKWRKHVCPTGLEAHVVYMARSICESAA